ncbi:helicase [Geothermobacter hydrogeniphilus]|uniref:Helicase n=2 Tax=Geothermobacter hydrogeniphilus TaxID=1969733 RepID=A0A2K2H8P9_9BACT|nr:helicase [Geothermobacter hydrogeniphilus]
MVIRNHKADVTDADGNFIFQGKTTRAVRVDVGEETVEFDRALQNYLRLGYAAGVSRGLKGQAIGFVMTTYRKLAASSSAAILASLERRLENLRSGDSFVQNPPLGEESGEFDSRFEGEMLEQAGLFDPAFFDGEISLLEDLIDKARALVANDRKLKCLRDDIIPAIHSTNPEEKILIFAEYRSTQNHLAEALREKYGEDSVELINGSMKHQDRKAAIARFEDRALFLLSTEAGGEGINLQRKCHVMINYDLPWNPMRLVQRIGRLYRYGQKKKVAVFNIHAPNTMDEEILGLMYERISAVVKDMAQVGEEFREGLEDDILGELAELIDIREVLEELPQGGLAHTKEKIEEALARAREASSKQRELFEYAASFDPEETKNELQIGSEHLEAFVRGMFRQLRIEIVAETHHGSVLQIRVPDDLVEKEPGLKPRFTVTFDRVMASSRPGVQMLDLDSPLMGVLLKEAKAHDFGGQSAASSGLEGNVLLTGVLRWQDDQGKRMRQEYAAVLWDGDGKVRLNPAGFGEWLKISAGSREIQPDKDKARRIFESLEAAADFRLAQVSNRDLHPEGRQWVSCLWLENN